MAVRCHHKYYGHVRTPVAWLSAMAHTDGWHLMFLTAGCTTVSEPTASAGWSGLLCKDSVFQSKCPKAQAGGFDDLAPVTAQHHICHVLLTGTSTRSTQVQEEGTRAPTFQWQSVKRVRETSKLYTSSITQIVFMYL